MSAPSVSGQSGASLPGRSAIERASRPSPSSITAASVPAAEFCPPQALKANRNAASVRCKRGRSQRERRCLPARRRGGARRPQSCWWPVEGGGGRNAPWGCSGARMPDLICDGRKDKDDGVQTSSPPRATDSEPHTVYHDRIRRGFQPSNCWYYRVENEVCWKIRTSPRRDKRSSQWMEVRWKRAMIDRSKRRAYDTVCRESRSVPGTESWVVELAPVCGVRIWFLNKYTEGWQS